MSLRHLVFDFDGTCTKVPASAAGFLDAYRALLGEAMKDPIAEADWNDALSSVRRLSPEEGWKLSGTPSAPAAADPYILAWETSALLKHRRKWKESPPPTLHGAALAGHEADFRDEMLEVLEELARLDLTMTFISNSSTGTVSHRLDLLLGRGSELRERIEVFGDASKMTVREPSPNSDGLLPAWLLAAFHALPAEGPRLLARPLYLRRGAYLAQLAKVWKDDPWAPSRTLIAGDIWELDLAMPAALGCAVHLIERDPPYQTCDYEREALRLSPRGRSSRDLRGLLDHARGLHQG